MYGSGVRMREDDRTIAVGHDVHRRAMTRVGTASHHPDACHFIEDLPAERRQAGIVTFLATAARAIVAVISDEHPADAEIVIELDEAGLIRDRVHSFDVEHDGELPVPSRPLDVAGGVDEHIIVRPLPQPPAQVPDHTDMLLNTLFAVADVKRDGVHARGSVALELRKEDFVLRAQRHAAVIVPNQAFLEQ